MRRPGKYTWGYIAALSVCLLAAIAAGWTALGTQIDNDAADWMFRLHPTPPHKLRSALLVFDDRSLSQNGGMRGLRNALADGLERLGTVNPRVVAIDITLAEADEETADERLQAALRKLSNVVLPCDLITGGWQEPYERFRKTAAAVGHVHADPDPLDSVTRHIPLQKAFDRQRRWAMSFEAFRLSLGGGAVIESPSELQVGERTIPVNRDPSHPLRIRFLQPSADGLSAIPTVTFEELRTHPESVQKFAGKVVFVGITSQSAAQDRWLTPISNRQPMPGVEIHAHAFETLAGGEFLSQAREYHTVLFCVLMVAAAGFVFAYLSGWLAYLLGALLLLIAHLFPYWLFTRDIVFPYFAPLAAAWLSVAVAASYQHFIVRRQLLTAEQDKARYQQAIHFVTHEMRTPLTAIQGSSELMTRYNLNDDKRKQIATMINSESKRLARMIQNFLDVERLNEGSLELKQIDFALADLAGVCVERARPVAERKQITIEEEPLAEATLRGDRELMEYAFYNILTNAVKYSPAGTLVRISSSVANGHVRLAVRDQGIGMDEKEVKKIFQKFYRTKRAEASGEVGTGIGLSIVEQIVTLHGGRIEVESAPGEGSCFTLVLPSV
jgi:signal transduction histidine kinase